MNQKLSLAAITLGTLLLTACGSGSNSDDDDTPAATTQDYLMLADGNRWAYDSGFWDSYPLNIQLVTLENALMADSTPVLLSTNRSIYGFGDFVQSRFQLDSHMLMELYDESDGEKLAVRGTMPLLQLPLREGDRYELYHFQNEAPLYDHDGDGITESESTRGFIEGIVRETVTVPAGTFDALRVDHKEVISWINSSDGSPGRQENTELTWYASGIGVVMRKTIRPNYWIWSRLRDYKVGGRSTDTTAPYILSVTPAPASVQATGPDIYIGFTLSEIADPLSRDAITQDAALQPVAGSWSTSGENTWFTPESQLLPGTYTVTLHGISDAMGNALAEPYSWSFTVVE